MERSVYLAKLPEGLEIPPELRGQVSFESAQRRLVFRGFMSKAVYDRLRSLHRDLAYAQAVEQLFQLSVLDDAAPFRYVSRTLGMLVVFCLVLGAVVWWQLLRDLP